MNRALRRDCHPEPDATQERCELRGCCWYPSGGPWCFYPAEGNMMGKVQISTCANLCFIVEHTM